MSDVLPLRDPVAAPNSERVALGPAPAVPPTGVLARLLPGPMGALALIVLAGTLCRLVWLNVPANSLIFDEAYYVNAARVMLGWPVPADGHYGDQPAGIDPNAEHPPLGKAAIAGSMALFGDTALGWRLPSLLAGFFSILLVFGIVVAAGGDRWTGVMAAGLFTFDNLALVHSRIGTLDMMLVALLLLGAWLALRKRPVLAGMASGLAVLVKLNGVFGLGALVLVTLAQAAWTWRDTGRWPRASFRAVGLMLLGFLPTVFFGLWALDAAFSAYRTPWAHLQHIVQYGMSLTNTEGPQGQESYPWQWLLNDVQMTYLRVDEEVRSGDAVIATRATISFRGAMNPVIIGAAPLAIGYAVWRMWRHRDLLSLWVVAWVAATFLPNLPLSMLEHRVSYIFYFLPTLAAVTVALAQLLRKGGLPRAVAIAYFAMVLVGFIGYFPFRRLV